jgi:hypothetical protein
MIDDYGDLGILELAACDAYNLPLLFSKDVLPDFL